MDQTMIEAREARWLLADLEVGLTFIGLEPRRLGKP